MSPRIIQLPLSGRDRRHYVTELRKAEQAYQRHTQEAAAAHAAADRALREAPKIKERFGRQKEFAFMIPPQAGPVVIESKDDPFKPLH
jgi:hypothetical protein